MAEATILVGSKRRTLTAPVFLAVVLAAAIARGLIGARTTTGRVVLLLTLGSLFVLCVAYAVWVARRPAERLEVRPERIVLWDGADSGIQLGATPPIRVQRISIGAGTNRSTTWVLADASNTAFRFKGQTTTPLDGVIARIDLLPFHPHEVFDAVQRAGWPAEQRS